MAKPTLTGLTFEQARQQSRNMRNKLGLHVTRQERADIVGVSVSAIASWDKEDRLLAKIENKDKKVKLLEGEIRGLRESCKTDKQPSNENKGK